MHLLSRLFLASALCLPAAAIAGEPAPKSEHRLSEAEVAKVLEEAARKREAAEGIAPKPKIEVHGEIGVTVGTGGYRSASGAAQATLPGNGTLNMSFDATNFGSRPRLGPHSR